MTKNNQNEDTSIILNTSASMNSGIFVQNEDLHNDYIDTDTANVNANAIANVTTNNNNNNNSANNHHSSSLETSTISIPDSPVVIPPPAAWYEHTENTDETEEGDVNNVNCDQNNHKVGDDSINNMDTGIDVVPFQPKHIHVPNNNHSQQHNHNYYTSPLSSPFTSPPSSPTRRKNNNKISHTARPIGIGTSIVGVNNTSTSASASASTTSIPTSPKSQTSSSIASSTRLSLSPHKNYKQLKTKPKPKYNPKTHFQNTVQSIHTITTSYIPSLTQEILYTSTRNIFHYTQKTYNQSLLFGKLQFKFSDVGNKNSGYDIESIRKYGIRICNDNGDCVLWKMENMNEKYYYHFYFHNVDDSYNQRSSHVCSGGARSVNERNMNGHTYNNKMLIGYGWEDEWDRQRVALPPFSSLDWVDRQLVKEWRTCDYMVTKQQLRQQCLDEQQQLQEQEQDNRRNSEMNEDILLCNDGDNPNYNENNDGESESESDDYKSFKSSHDKQHYTEQDKDVAMQNSIYHDNDDNDDMDNYDDDKIGEDDFIHAKTFLPKPMPRPPWENATSCYTCRKTFNSTCLRHHCRLCGRSYCHDHSSYTHRLPHLGYDPDVPERTCGQCKHYLNLQNLAERIAWRMARCRDFLISPIDLFPYFETGVDTVEDAAVRLTKAAIHMAKSIPMGAQATVAVETLDVLRKHGLKGVYGLILRKEFMAAADLLCKVTGINKKVWPLSVHELSAAIFYALAQHRALRGIDPEREHRIHLIQCCCDSDCDSSTVAASVYSVPSIDIIDDEKFVQPSSIYREVDIDNTQSDDNQHDDSSIEADVEEPGFKPVCEPVSDSLLASLIFYAPVAMNFIYAKNEVDMQLLAAQQGWRLIYAHLTKDGYQVTDMPAFALFVHMDQNIACLTIRGTATINDVVTDIRAMPVQFPDAEIYVHDNTQKKKSAVDDEDWTEVLKGQGLALCGMAGAAYNLFRENVEALLLFARKGYRIRLVGHSLGGGVAALIGALMRRELVQELIKPNFDVSKQTEKKEPTQLNIEEMLRVYTYGSPACVDTNLAEFCKSYVVSCVLHDDVIPRLTPTSIRALLKHLLYIRETWVKAHLANDLMAITERAKKAWAPRLRNGFTLMSAQKPSVKMYKKLKAKGSFLKRKVTKCTGIKKSKKDAIQHTTNYVENEIPSSDEKIVGHDENVDTSDEGLLYEGDFFFEADQSLIEHSDEDSDSDGKLILR